jgi:multidrug efflux pump subunit AcrA (membrane-fusion protein)
MKRALIIIVIVVVAAAAVFLFRLRAIEESRQEREELVNGINRDQVTPVVVAPVITGDVERTLKYTGTVQPEDEVEVFSKIAGRLITVKVEEGDRVSKDMTVAVIDPEITGQRFEPFEVTSPLRGNVANVFLDAGTYINQMQPIVKIIDDRYVKVEIDVLEKDYHLVKKGTSVRLVFDAIPGEVRRAKVTNVSPVVDPMTGTAVAEIRMANSDGMLKAGMFARVEVIIEVREDAVLMPLAATLTEILPGRGVRVETTAFVADGDIARERQVVLGLAGPTHYEVLEGLEPGEQVVIVGQNLVTDGGKLRITRTEG